MWHSSTLCLLLHIFVKGLILSSLVEHGCQRQRPKLGCQRQRPQFKVYAHLNCLLNKPVLVFFYSSVEFLRYIENLFMYVHFICRKNPLICISRVDIAFFILFSGHQWLFCVSWLLTLTVVQAVWRHVKVSNQPCAHLSICQKVLKTAHFDASFKANKFSWFIASYLKCIGQLGSTPVGPCSLTLQVMLVFGVSPSADRMLPWLRANNTLVLCFL